MGQASQADGRPKRAESRKDEIIHIRASAEMKGILNQAAALRGQKLSEFMLDSAHARAEETILDQRAFFLEPKMHDAFLAMLDTPIRPDKELRAAMRRKPAWQR
ncbi:MAG TPA: DUF1778 domain-containing protein [Woeseiaceae bacterium]|nr:DUF1778 domain-containing protein [Woeseiaceae bacterium]